jgi:hypothetical protein
MSTYSNRREFVSWRYWGCFIDRALNSLETQKFSLIPDKTGLTCDRSTNELFNEPPKLSQQKRQEKQYQSTSLHRNNRTPYYVTIHNINQIVKRKKRDNFFLPLSPGNTARHPQVLHPSAEKLNPPDEIGKGCPREYTQHTDMGIHEDI